MGTELLDNEGCPRHVQARVNSVTVVQFVWDYALDTPIFSYELLNGAHLTNGITPPVSQSPYFRRHSKTLQIMWAISLHWIIS